MTDRKSLRALMDRMRKTRKPKRIKWFRRFDLHYWQMREALGYPIPIWVDEKWPKSFGHWNPHKCGSCESRRLYPELHWQEMRDRAQAAKQAAGEG